MAFKVGDRVKTLADDDGELFPIGTVGVISEIGGCSDYRYKVCANNDFWWYTESMLAPYSEKTYEQGLADAWELAKRLVCVKEQGGLSTDVMDKLFNSIYPEDVFDNYSCEEVIAKVKEYEERTKITPSKIVEDNEGTRALVLDDYGEGVYFVLTENGCVENWHREGCVAVLDRTIDVSELVKQIGGR